MPVQAACTMHVESLQSEPSKCIIGERMATNEKLPKAARVRQQDQSLWLQPLALVVGSMFVQVG